MLGRPHRRSLVWGLASRGPNASRGLFFRSIILKTLIHADKYAEETLIKFSENQRLNQRPISSIMPITRSKKGEIINDLKGIFKDSKTVVFVNFHGLNVSDSSILRKDLKNSEIGYLVAKKTLVRKVLEGSKIMGDTPALEGELSIAFGKDLLEPARKIYSFQKKLENRISILGGLFDGRFVDKQEMTEIAQIPPRETLYAQFVNLINSPIKGLAVALDQIAKTKGKTV